ncbi:MAG: class I SAM-dependent DNA methyltransferase [Spirochaetota bacterium]
MDTKDYFDGEVAARYDVTHAAMFDEAVVESAVDVLAGLAGPGPALELGIGTGRIGLPLAARGVEVHGVELSEAMVRELRKKPGGGAIPVTIGDFASVHLQERYALVYLVFNTIMNLTTQAAQVDCFVRAASHLLPGGRFVIEVMVPDLRRLPPGDRVRPFAVSDDYLGFDEYHTASQRLVSHHYGFQGREHTLRSIPFRYVWPSELDLMARIARLSLENRWASWRRDPFTDDSASHVSVWRL